MTTGPDPRLAPLSALLDELWDPLGVYDGPVEDRAPAGRYRQYAPALLKLLDRGATTAEVAWHLRDLAHTQLDLPPVGNESEIADLLRRWHTLWTD